MSAGDTSSGTTAAVGTFDGVHRGHRAVLDMVIDRARNAGLEPIAITFDRHPLSVIAPEREPLALTTLRGRGRLLAETGVRPVVIPFDETLRATTADQWMALMAHRYGVKVLVVGYDNTFGSDGVSLTLGDYRRMGREHGIEVVEAPYVDGVSSSAVRKTVGAGNVAEAAKMMGRPFSLPGIVVEGNRLGRTIGFPTANLLPEPGIVVPADGVYAARVTLPDNQTFPAIVNIGVRPTVRRGENRTVEAHIIGWGGDLYGKNIKIAFVDRIRDEVRFNSIDALRAQIEKDRATAKKILAPAK